MASQESSQYAKAYTQEPVGKLDPKELNGRVRRIFAEAILSSEIAIGETIKMAKLPANASIISAKLSANAGAGLGVLDLGWAAGSEGLEIADPNGIITGATEVSTASQNMDETINGGDPAYNKKFSEPVDIELIATAATTASAGGAIYRLELLYTID